VKITRLAVGRIIETGGSKEKVGEKRGLRVGGVKPVLGSPSEGGTQRACWKQSGGLDPEELSECPDLIFLKERAGGPETNIRGERG